MKQAPWVAATLPPPCRPPCPSPCGPVDGDRTLEADCGRGGGPGRTATGHTPGGTAMRSKQDTLRQPLFASLLALTVACTVPEQAGDEGASAAAESVAAMEVEMPPAPMADPADVESVEAIVTAVYESISGDAGVPRDWDRFRSLFLPGARLMPVATEHLENGRRSSITSMSPEEVRGGDGRVLRRGGFLRGRDRPRHRDLRRHLAPLQQLRGQAHRRPGRGALQPRHQLVPAPARRRAVVGPDDLLAARAGRGSDPRPVSGRLDLPSKTNPSETARHSGPATSCPAVSTVYGVN